MITGLLASAGISIFNNLVSKHGEKLVSKGIEKVTGVKLEGKKELSKDEIEAIRLNGDRILKLDFEKLKLDYENTKDARNMNVKIQESSNASNLSKNASYYIDFLIIGATIAVGLALFFLDIPEGNKELAYMMFGSLVTMCGTVVNFHRGSSHGSKSKTEYIKGL